MQHTCLYISGQIQKICFLQFKIVICLLIIVFQEKTKNCKTPQFCKIFFIVFVFDRFFLSETVLAMFAIGFNGFFSLFCQVLGGFWWFPIMVLTEKKYTQIYEEHGDRASNKAFFVCKLDCKSFLNAFGIKNRQFCLRR